MKSFLVNTFPIMTTKFSQPEPYLVLAPERVRCWSVMFQCGVTGRHCSSPRVLSMHLIVSNPATSSAR